MTPAWREWRESFAVLGVCRTLYLRFGYRHVMRLAHRFNWHYAPPNYPDGDTVLRCRWCGFQAVVFKRSRMSDALGIRNVPPSAFNLASDVPGRQRSVQ